jgi:hypothetical protein
VAFDFPATPANGAQFQPAPGGPVWVWDAASTAWRAGSGALPLGVIISDTAPANPYHGLLWWESDTGNTYIFYVDPGGAPGQWVQFNVASPIVDAPFDGGEYVRRNGIWRLKSQSFDLAGKTTQPVSVPAWGPARVRLNVHAYLSNSNALGLQLSLDGTTFIANADAYAVSGFVHSSGTNSFQNVPPTLQAQWLLTSVSAEVLNPQIGDAVITLRRLSATAGIHYQGHGSTNDPNSAAIYWATRMFGGYINAVRFPGAGPVQALRLILTSAGTFTSGTLNVEWIE